MKKIHVYTDGACTGNPGNAGIGIFIQGEINCKISKYIGKKTNNYAELLAIKTAITFLFNKLRKNKEKFNIKVFSDSKYSLGVIENRNWNIVKNKNLILVIRKRVDKFRKQKNISISFHYVKGYSGNFGNNQADKLAVIGKNPLKRNFKHEF